LDNISAINASVISSDSDLTLKECRIIHNNHIKWNGEGIKINFNSNDKNLEKSLSLPLSAKSESSLPPLKSKSLDKVSSGISKAKKPATSFFKNTKTANSVESPIEPGSEKKDSSSRTSRPLKEDIDISKPATTTSKLGSWKNPVSKSDSISDSVQSQPIVAPQISAESQKIMDLFDDDKETNQRNGEKNSDQENAHDAIAVPVPKRVRKKRKIIKSETVLEGKYMTTRDVECWESYSEDEFDSPIVTKKGKTDEKAKASGASNKGKFVQRTMNSFFGRSK
jgi:hypothetical protein